MKPSRTWSVAGEIRQGMPHLTPTERKVADAILANYPVAGLETLSEVARKSSVSGPTVHRFISKLGYTGYPEFQQAIRQELEAQFQSPLTKQPGEDSVAGGKADFLGGYMDTALRNIRRTMEQVSRADFDAVVDILSDRQRPVYVLGGRFTDALAQYLYLHLHAIRQDVQHIGGQPAFWLETLLNVGEGDVFLIFDIRRYQDDVIHFARQAVRRKATVILLTDRWLSPITNVAEYVFPVHIEVPSIWDSAAATLVLIEALVAAVNQRRWPEVRERLERLEELRKSHVDSE